MPSGTGPAWHPDQGPQSALLASGAVPGDSQGQGSSTGVRRKGGSEEKFKQGEKPWRLWAQPGVGGSLSNQVASATMCRSLH